MDINAVAAWANIVAIPVAIIFGIVSVVLGVVVYRRQRQRKEVVYFFDEIETPIEIKSGDALEGDIQINYKDQPVNNIFVVRATVTNHGNVSVRPEDIFEPLTFSFGPKTALLREPRIVRTHPVDLKIGCRVKLSEDNLFRFAAIVDLPLFRPKDSFTVEMLCTGPNQNPVVTWLVDAQFGITSPAELNRRTNSVVAVALGVAGMIVTLLFTFFAISPEADGGAAHTTPSERLDLVIWLLAAVIGVLLSLIARAWLNHEK